MRRWDQSSFSQEEAEGDTVGSKGNSGASLAAQWLRLCTSTAAGSGSSQSGTRIPHAVWHGQKKENSSEGVKPQNLSLGSRHVPLVPKFDASLGVRALGPKSPWKIHTSFCCLGPLPSCLLLQGCVFRQLHCIFRTIFNLQAIPAEPECLAKNCCIRSSGLLGAKGNSSSGPRQVWAGSNQRVEEGKEGSPAYREAW